MVATVWGYQLQLEGADDPRLEAFMDEYYLNPDYVPEPGASCDGGSSDTL